MRLVRLLAVSFVIVSLSTLGCQKEQPAKTGTTTTKKAEEDHKDHQDHEHKDAKSGAVSSEDKIKAARAKLSPEDLKLVEAQEYCPIMPKNRLGAMGDIVKATIEGQPVFFCCDDCPDEAKADPKKTLAKVEELKKKVKDEKK